MVDEPQRSMNGEKVGAFVNEITGTRFPEFVPAIVEIALMAGRELNLKLTAMRTAILEGDEVAVMVLARELCRIDDQENYAD